MNLKRDMRGLIALGFLVPSLAFATSLEEPVDVVVIGSSAELPVNIVNTPNVNATIQGTPNVNTTIQGTPEVNATIQGVPNVNATIEGIADVAITNSVSVVSSAGFDSLSNPVNERSTTEMLVWVGCGLLFGIGFIGGNKI